MNVQSWKETDNHTAQDSGTRYDQAMLDVGRSQPGLFAALVIMGSSCGADPPTSAYGDGIGSADEGIVITGGQTSKGTTTGGQDGDGANSGTADSASGDQGGDDYPIKFDVGGDDETGSSYCTGTGGGSGQTSFSYIWIANTAEGTVSKINTVDGVELGRYRTGPGSDSPSRTSVNQYGDVLVGNRSGDFGVTKIAAQLENCIDRNDDGQIQTSTGASDVLAWMEDECILWYTEMPVYGNNTDNGSTGDGPRAIAWEGGQIDPITCINTNPDPRVWIGYGDEDQEIWRLDGATGSLDTADHIRLGAAPGSGFTKLYGGAVNANGDFWAVVRGSNLLYFVDGETLTVETFDMPNNAYGMGVDQYGDPWIATWGTEPNGVYRFDHDTEMFVSGGFADAGRYRGMNIDRQGRLWVAGNLDCRLSLYDSASETLINDDITLENCNTPVGISIDFNGFVWVVDQGGFAYKVNPETLTVELRVEGLNQPYTYSDMTGSGLNLVINPPG